MLVTFNVGIDTMIQWYNNTMIQWYIWYHWFADPGGCPSSLWSLLGSLVPGVGQGGWREGGHWTPLTQTLPLQSVSQDRPPARPTLPFPSLPRLLPSSGDKGPLKYGSNYEKKIFLDCFGKYISTSLTTDTHLRDVNNILTSDVLTFHFQTLQEQYVYQPLNLNRGSQFIIHSNSARMEVLISAMNQSSYEMTDGKIWLR